MKWKMEGVSAEVGEGGQARGAGLVPENARKTAKSRNQPWSGGNGIQETSLGSKGPQLFRRWDEGVPSTLTKVWGKGSEGHLEVEKGHSREDGRTCGMPWYSIP